MAKAKYCVSCGCYIPDNSDQCLACGKRICVSASNTTLWGNASTDHYMYKMMAQIEAAKCLNNAIAQNDFKHIGLYKGYECVMVTTYAKFREQEKQLNQYKYVLVKDTNTVWVNTGTYIGWMPCDTNII